MYWSPGKPSEEQLQGKICSGLWLVGQRPWDPNAQVALDALVSTGLLGSWEMGSERPELEMAVAHSRSRGFFGTRYVMFAREKCRCDSEWLCL